MKAFAQTVLVALSLLGPPGQAASAEGWLLLLPPVDQAKLQSEATGPSTYSVRAVVDAATGAFLLPMAPLREWDQFRAFDSAAACETWRLGFQEAAEIVTAAGCCDSLDSPANASVDYHRFLSTTVTVQPSGGGRDAPPSGPS